MSTETQIVLKQIPIITHQLQKAGKNVQKRIDDLELDKQIVTEENRQAMKVLRAELSKEFKGYEEQRGIIKNAVNNPYNEFETVYKTEITERYKSADDLLKEKIDSVELQMKRNKESNLKTYFEELANSEKIDFLVFDNLGLKIDLSTTEKKYKEQINGFVEKVNDDLKLIKATDFEAEILTEYKKTLNASKAITEVKERKEKEEKEKARIKAELIQNRKNYLEKLGLNHVEITNQWEFNEEIFVSLKDIEELSKEDFTAKYAEIQAKINDLKTKEADTIKSTVIEAEVISEPVKKEVSKPVAAPIEIKPTEEIKTASLEVKATLSKLRALGEYMKQNEIEYKNI